LLLELLEQGRIKLEFSGQNAADRFENALRVVVFLQITMATGPQ
jgi:hypothetical protein